MQQMFTKSSRRTSTVSDEDDFNYLCVPADDVQTKGEILTMVMVMYNAIIYSARLMVLMIIVAVIKKGQVMSNYYRLMNRQGEF